MEHRAACGGRFPKSKIILPEVSSAPHRVCGIGSRHLFFAPTTFRTVLLFSEHMPVAFFERSCGRYDSLRCGAGFTTVSRMALSSEVVCRAGARARTETPAAGRAAIPSRTIAALLTRSRYNLSRAIMDLIQTFSAAKKASVEGAGLQAYVARSSMPNMSRLPARVSVNAVAAGMLVWLHCADTPTNLTIVPDDGQVTLDW